MAVDNEIDGTVLVVHGDITRLSAHAVVYSTDWSLSEGGQLTAAFEAQFPGFGPKYAELRGAHAKRSLTAGDSFFIPRSGSDLPRGIVVTVAAGGRMPRAERAALAAAGALRCALEHLERASVPKPWLVALPCFLAGDGGARHDRVTVAEPQIQAALDVVRAERDVDVAFIAYTESNYQVWLEARRRVWARAGIAARGPEPDERLVASVALGECVIFAGSGLSAGSGLPGWGELIDQLADDLGVPQAERRGDLEYLLDLAQWYRNEGLSPSIEERIRRTLTAEASGARPTLAQYLLASLPSRYFVTTNYDDLFEAALEGLRRHAFPVVAESDVARTGSPDGCYVVKFHGCAVRESTIVLARDDYDGFFRTRPAMALLLEGLLLNQSFLFVGYGLRDPDFRQIWSRIGAMLQGAKRPAFATTFDPPSRHAFAQWAKQGLHLFGFEGPSPAQKARLLHRFLDRLAEVVARDPHLVLADDVESSFSDGFRSIRERLLTMVPDLALACARAGSATRSEVLALADILRFFVGHGWRGAMPGHVAGLFAFLALHRDLTRDERRDLLVSALRHTESAEEAAKLERKIAQT
jgi:O-acetyl-ADP-ribose deacetylase (regulator of RNase III)